MNIKAIPAAIMMFACACAGAQEQDITQWTLNREGSKQSIKVTVPCTVAGALNATGALGEDVYVGENYKNIDKSQFDVPWVYTAKFKANTSLRNVLRFKSLSYSADIILNGKVLATADTTVGPFIVREYDVNGIVKANNTLQVKVYKAPAQSLNHGYVDWNPRPVDESMGILGAVTLIATPNVQIQDLFVKPVVNVKDLTDASFIMEATLVNRSAKPVKGTLKATYEGGYIEIPVNMAAGAQRWVPRNFITLAPCMPWEPRSPTARKSPSASGTSSRSLWTANTAASSSTVRKCSSRAPAGRTTCSCRTPRKAFANRPSWSRIWASTASASRISGVRTIPSTTSATNSVSWQ